MKAGVWSRPEDDPPDGSAVTGHTDSFLALLCADPLHLQRPQVLPVSEL